MSNIRKTGKIWEEAPHRKKVLLELLLRELKILADAPIVLKEGKILVNKEKLHPQNEILNATLKAICTYL